MSCAIAGKDNYIRKWDMQTAEQEHSYGQYDSSPNCLAVQPRSDRERKANKVAVGFADASIALFDTGTWDLKIHSSEHDVAVYALAFLEDMLFSGRPPFVCLAVGKTTT